MSYNKPQEEDEDEDEEGQGLNRKRRHEDLFLSPLFLSLSLFLVNLSFPIDIWIACKWL